MTDNAYIYIISPVVTAVIGGVSYLVKRYLKRIEDRITQTELRQSRTEVQLKKVVSIVMSCNHADCPTKEKVLEVWGD